MEIFVSRLISLGRTCMWSLFTYHVGGTSSNHSHKNGKRMSSFFWLWSNQSDARLIQTDIKLALLLPERETQFVIFKPLSYSFKEKIGFDVKASFASRSVSRLIRWYNKPGEIIKEFWEKAIQFHGSFHGLKIANWTKLNRGSCVI